MAGNRREKSDTNVLLTNGFIAVLTGNGGGGGRSGSCGNSSFGGGSTDGSDDRGNVINFAVPIVRILIMELYYSFIVNHQK